jgi:GNAT superfamily N-acetyltransferase
MECVNTLAELGADRLRTMTTFWNPKLADRNIRERFARGASLWLAMSGNDLAGYGWTLQGATIDPYYFPLSQSDVHLFDFQVFPDFRGRGINPLLVTQILVALAHDGHTRAFIEAAAWNDAQLASLRKTPFHLLGTVRSLTIARHRVTRWSGDNRTALATRRAEPGERRTPNPGPNSERAAR